MDCFTLRKLAQAPGMNLAQKAGSRQELLAVVRRDTVDLQENRILLWVARRVRRMAASYCERNAGFVESQRFQKVKRFLRLCNNVLASPRLAEVSQLEHHLSSPTYCLQYDTKYRQVWRAYMMIRKQDKLEDDAWTWQSHLWGTTARLLAGAMLVTMEDWLEIRESTPFFRIHADCGEWTHGPSTPGPFETPFGRCEVYDLRESGVDFYLQACKYPATILDSGADWVLIWPAENRATLLWAAVAVGSPGEGRPGFGTRALMRRLKEESRRTGWSFGGVLFIAEPEVEGGSVNQFAIDPQLLVIQVPVDVHTAWSDIKTCLRWGLEEFHRE